MKDLYNVTVIVPTYNRSKLLGLTLESLLLQSVGTENIQIIVVDDGSTDDTKEIVREYQLRTSIKYCFQEDLGYRVASARNVGMQYAINDVVLFVDSGVVLGSQCIESHLYTHQLETAPVAVIGNILGLQASPNELQWMENQAGDPDNLISRLQELNIYSDIREEVYALCDSNLSSLPAPWVLFWTGNVSVKRSTLLEVGLFDTNFDLRWGMEDIDLGLRLFNFKIKFLLSRKAISFHFPHKNDVEKKRIEEFHNKKYLFSKHPCIETETLLQSDTVSLNSDLLKKGINRRTA